MLAILCKVHVEFFRSYIKARGVSSASCGNKKKEQKMYICHHIFHFLTNFLVRGSPVRSPHEYEKNVSMMMPISRWNAPAVRCIKFARVFRRPSRCLALLISPRCVVFSVNIYIMMLCADLKKSS